MKKIIAVALLLVLAACSKAPHGGATSERSAAAAEPVMIAGAPPPPADANQATRRYLALTHQVKLLVPGATLAQRFAAIQADCIRLGCEILSAGQVTEGAHQEANATLSARVPPAAFAGFFTGIQRQGRLLSHQSQSEDKTAEVIDIEARIKNLEALKARVLELLANRTGSLKDVLEAEKELADTQTTLDSIRGQRRVLASQTDMVKIDIELRPESVVNEGNWAAPVAMAAKDAGGVLMSSLAFLLTASVALLPWALVSGVLFAVLRRYWRRRRARQADPGR